MLNKNFAVIQHRKLTCVATVIIETFTMLRKVLYYDNMKQVRKNAEHTVLESHSGCWFTSIYTLV